jgi:hypothetical protein
LNNNAVIKHGAVKKLWPVLAIAACFVAIAVLLRFEGRLWLCACGRLQVWSGDICSADNSQHFLDPYSFTHVLHGFAFFWLISWLASRFRPAWQLTLAVALEAAWEAFENTNFIIDRYRASCARLHGRHGGEFHWRHSLLLVGFHVCAAPRLAPLAGCVCHIGVSAHSLDQRQFVT